MTVQLLITFATSLLEYKHLVGLARVVENSCLHHCTLYVRGTDLYRSVCIHEEKLVELNSSTFLSRKAVDKDFIASFYLELLACDVHNCVHYTKKL